MSQLEKLVTMWVDTLSQKTLISELYAFLRLHNIQAKESDVRCVLEILHNKGLISLECQRSILWSCTVTPL